MTPHTSRPDHACHCYRRVPLQASSSKRWTAERVIDGASRSMVLLVVLLVALWIAGASR